MKGNNSSDGKTNFISIDDEWDEPGNVLDKDDSSNILNVENNKSQHENKSFQSVNETNKTEENHNKGNLLVDFKLMIVFRVI